MVNVPSPKRGGRLQLGKPVEETVRAPRSAFIHTDSEGRPLTGADDDPRGHREPDSRGPREATGLRSPYLLPPIRPQLAWGSRSTSRAPSWVTSRLLHERPQLPRNQNAEDDSAHVPRTLLGMYMRHDSGKTDYALDPNHQ